MKPKVVIIGAGPAGLTAGYLLSKNDVDVLVLEADRVYVGGISRTATYKGFHFDIGGHPFFSKTKNGGGFWAENFSHHMPSRPPSPPTFFCGAIFFFSLHSILHP